ncbi:hypothetical protein NicSoilC12_32160 [Arthrobacter sp. NicSoilC12]|nr:hypothetical protein NicSoilC12_32160 [Arthrobacter sp. NicSoilC12]
MDRIVAGQVIAVEYRSHDVEEDCRCGVVLAVVCLRCTKAEAETQQRGGATVLGVVQAFCWFAAVSVLPRTG